MRVNVESYERENDMNRSLKAIGTMVIAFAIVGIAMKFVGLPRSSTAGANPETLAVSISPKELTRTAGPMPVQDIENYQ